MANFFYLDFSPIILYILFSFHNSLVRTEHLYRLLWVSFFFPCLLETAPLYGAFHSKIFFQNLIGTLQGKVVDEKDGKPIPGVVISIPDLKLGTLTDINGQYQIHLIPKGIFLVQVKYIGYATINQKVDFSKTEILNFSLTSSTIEAGEVIITGVSRATELKRSPIPIIAINKDFIEQHAGAGNAVDVLANLPGINAVTTGPNVSKPFIHGLGYNRVVTLQDGIRQEGQQWGDEHGIEVDQNSVDRVEIIKGPASLSYGSDAIGGVVNFISPIPPPDGIIKAELTQVYGTNNGLLNSSLRLYSHDKGIVLGFIGSWKQAKAYQNAQDGRVYNTGFQEKDFRWVTGINRKRGSSTFNITFFDDLQEIPDGSRDSASRRFTKKITDLDTFRPIVTPEELNAYSITVNHQHVELFRIYNNSTIGLDKGTLLVNLGYQFSHRREFTHPQYPDIPGLNLSLHTYTYDIKYNWNVALGYEATVGLNGMYQTNGIYGGTAFPIPAYHQFDIGPFGVIKKSFGKLDLSLGARFDNRSFSGQGAFLDTSNPDFLKIYTGTDPEHTPDIILQFQPLNKNFNGFSGSLGGTYNVSNAFLFKANIARGFRAPSIAELSANGPDPGSQIYHLGNSQFKPEFAVQEDFGIFLTLPMVSASMEIFNNTIQNYIFQRQVTDAEGYPVQKQGYNEFTYVQSKAVINGGEFYVDIHLLPWLHFSNSMTLTYGKNKGEKGFIADSLQYLPFIPPLHTHTEIRASFHKNFSFIKNSYASIGLDHYNPQYQYFKAYGTETATSGYNLLSAGLGWDIMDKNGKEIGKFFIEGNNLNNEIYQSHLSRLKYFDPNYNSTVTRPGIFNIGRNISFKVIIPLFLKDKPV